MVKMWPEITERRGFPAPGRGKYLCTECLWAAKGPCPQHPGKSRYMGKIWRPGRKNTKWRLWDNRMRSQLNMPRRGWSRVAAPAQPPADLMALGAFDNTRGAGRGPYDDPVTRAIFTRRRRGKVPQQLDPSRPKPFL